MPEGIACVLDDFESFHFGSRCWRSTIPDARTPTQPATRATQVTGRIGAESASKVAAPATTAEAMTGSRGEEGRRLVIPGTVMETAGERTV